MLAKAAQTGTIITVEDHNVHSGLGSIIAEALVEQQLTSRLIKLGVRDYPISGTSDDVFAWAGLSTEALIKTISDTLQR
jgi:transketolase